MDGDEWEARLKSGQKLAREAEVARRSAGDTQRSFESTIAMQAEELERLREEARPRAQARWRRSAEVGLLGGEMVSDVCMHDFRVLKAMHGK